VTEVPEEVRARLEQAARLYDQAAEELDGAAAHCRRAAEHFRNGDVPRAAAHAWAAFGHVREAEQRLDDQARDHRLRSQV
jgi:TPR repeat protein